MWHRIDLRIVFVGLAATVATSVGFAGNKTSRAEALPGGSVAVRAVFNAPNPCVALSPAQPGIPAGVTPAVDAIPGIIRVRNGEAPCAAVITQRPIAAKLPDKTGAREVELFFVGDGGSVLASQRLLIRR